MIHKLSKLSDRFKARYGLAVAFMLLALAAGWSIKHSADVSADKLRASQVASCIRGNALRVESNRRVAAHIRDRNTLAEFLAAAEKARRAAPMASDKRAADEYHRLRVELLDKVTFKLTPLVNCEKTIPKT